MPGSRRRLRRVPVSRPPRRSAASAAGAIDLYYGKAAGDSGVVPNGEAVGNNDSNGSAPEPRHDPARADRFVRRIHRLRTLGLALGALCVASVLRLHDKGPLWWVLLALNGFVWPQLAHALTRRSADPRRTERRNLIFDSALGGMWVAAMHFNLLPSVLLVTMLSVDKVGPRSVSLLARSTLALAGACVLTSTVLGFPVDVDTPMSVVVACVPFLVIYPLAISGVTITLARRVTDQNRLLEQLGRTDGLTGLANRRQCLVVAGRELARGARSGRPAVLMVIDIDRFKDINDRYGHPVGDDVLCGVAAVLRASTRVIDTAGRYGGDEYLIVMPETTLAGAEEAARRIRARLAALKIAGAPELRCTVSIGAAQTHRDTRDVGIWVHEADAALYSAKASGRDRFVAAGSEPGLEPSSAAAPRLSAERS
jgi:diguanylate cyclase